MKKILFLLCLLYLLGCNKSQVEPIKPSDPTNLFIGSWVLKKRVIELGKEEHTFERVKQSQTDKICYTFEANGKFLAIWGPSFPGIWSTSGLWKKDNGSIVVMTVNDKDYTFYKSAFLKTENELIIIQ